MSEKKDTISNFPNSKNKVFISKKFSLGTKLEKKNSIKFLNRKINMFRVEKERELNDYTKRKLSEKDNNNEGRWTKEEHEKFLEGLVQYGINWKKVKNFVDSRTSIQVRSHAQKFFKKLKNIKDESLGIDFTSDSIKNIKDMMQHMKAIKDKFNIKNLFIYLSDKCELKNKKKTKKKNNSNIDANLNCNHNFFFNNNTYNIISINNNLLLNSLNQTLNLINLLVNIILNNNSYLGNQSIGNNLMLNLTNYSFPNLPTNNTLNIILINNMLYNLFQNYCLNNQNQNSNALKSPNSEINNRNNNIIKDNTNNHNIMKDCSINKLINDNGTINDNKKRNDIKIKDNNRKKDVNSSNNNTNNMINNNNRNNVNLFDNNNFNNINYNSNSIELIYPFLNTANISNNMFNNRIFDENSNNNFSINNNIDNLCSNKYFWQ